MSPSKVTTLPVRVVSPRGNEEVPRPPAPTVTLPAPPEALDLRVTISRLVGTIP